MSDQPHDPPTPEGLMDDLEADPALATAVSWTTPSSANGTAGAMARA